MSKKTRNNQSGKCDNAQGARAEGKSSYERNNNGRRNRGGRDQQPKGDYGDFKSYVVGQSGRNDPEWYTVNSQLVEATTKIPIYPFAGKPIVTNSYHGGVGINYTVPGVMVLRYVPIPGIANKSNDAINIAAQNIFQAMRKKLSTVANYQPADVMMMILAIDSVYMQVANLTRLYGLINAWNTDNWYLPNDLVSAAYNLSVTDLQTLRNNANDFRTRLNMLIYKAASLYAPMNFNIVKRHLWLVSNVFCDDGANSRAQYYVPTVQYFPQLDETTVDTGTSLVYENLATGNVYTMLNALDKSIDLIRNSDSYTMIMADMRRAFEGVDTIQLAYVPENYIVSATNSPYFKEQLHNATLASSVGNVIITGTAKYPGSTVPGDDRFNQKFRIYQDVDANTIISEPYLQFTGTRGTDYTPLRLMGQDKLLNLYSSDTSTKVLSEATRSMLIVHGIDEMWNASSPTRIAKVDSAGGDILLSASIYVHNKTGLPTEIPFYQIIGSAWTNSEKYGAVQKQLSASLPFDFSPMQFYCEGDGKEILPMTEIDYYMVVPNSTLSIMNETIDTSVWDLPRIVETNMSGGSKI